jgi:hypothetical protein
MLAIFAAVKKIALNRNTDYADLNGKICLHPPHLFHPCFYHTNFIKAKIKIHGSQNRQF